MTSQNPIVIFDNSDISTQNTKPTQDLLPIPFIHRILLLKNPNLPVTSNSGTFTSPINIFDNSNTTTEEILSTDINTTNSSAQSIIVLNNPHVSTDTHDTPSSISSTHDSRLNHLMQSCAFDHERFSCTKCHDIDCMLQRWEITQEGIQTLKSQLNFQDLKQLKNSRTCPVHTPELISPFRFI